MYFKRLASLMEESLIKELPFIERVRGKMACQNARRHVKNDLPDLWKSFCSVQSAAVQI
jgi:hypothetical protein